MTDLCGKTVLITGGGSGVGAAIAVAMAKAGASVWIAGRTQKSLHSTAQLHSAISTIVADVTDEKSTKKMFKACGPCDIVIANAGASQSAPFAKTDCRTWDQMIAVNLTGVFLTFREGLKQLPKSDGRLIAISSSAGLKGYAYVGAYAAAKHGVIGIVKSLALEVAKTEITVNAICPGFLDTPMTERSIENIIAKTSMNKQDAETALTSHNPQGRLIQPQEVAATALWLCSDEARSINGQAISISGGEV